MPVEVGLWNVSNTEVNRINYESIQDEKRLEDIIEKDVSILGDDYMLIGRQVRTKHGKIIDILLIDDQGNVTVVELKKSRTPRDVVAQVIDYASWVNNLTYLDLKSIYEDYKKDAVFETDFEEVFGASTPDELNNEHSMMIVSSHLDPETERIINYLSDVYSVPINAVFFRFFKDDGKEYLSRSWLIDPSEVDEKSSKSKQNKKSEPWNGIDFVANIRVEDEKSAWQDYQDYGFISAGGGTRYSKPLIALFPGARVFAMIPSKGYVGVGEVTGRRMHIADFEVAEKGTTKRLLDVSLNAEYLKDRSENTESGEYIVPIKWLATEPEEKAYWEKGLRANQNTVFRLKNQFTIDTLTSHFDLEQELHSAE